jgi:hypothetical protein
MSGDDPRAAPTGYAEPAQSEWLPPPTSSARAAPKLKQTVMFEGEMIAPSTLRMTELTLGEAFSARLWNSARSVRRGALIAALVLAAVVSIIGTAAAGASVACVAISLAILAALPALLLWRWASAELELIMDRREFALRGLSFMGPGHVRMALADVHGFGFQRSHRGVPRYQLVVVSHTGMTTAIDLPCTRMEEVRFVSRRLNAELARVQAER